MSLVYIYICICVCIYVCVCIRVCVFIHVDDHRMISLWILSIDCMILYALAAKATKLKKLVLHPHAAPKAASCSGIGCFVYTYASLSDCIPVWIK